MPIKGTPVLSEEEVDGDNDDDDGCGAGYDGDCGGDAGDGGSFVS